MNQPSLVVVVVVEMFRRHEFIPARRLLHDGPSIDEQLTYDQHQFLALASASFKSTSLPQLSREVGGLRILPSPSW